MDAAQGCGSCLSRSRCGLVNDPEFQVFPDEAHEGVAKWAMEAWRIRDPYALHHVVAHLRAWHDAVPGAPSIDASSALYSLVLDDAFRAARIDDTGNSTAVLTDLDTALATALGADDTAAVVALRGGGEISAEQRRCDRRDGRGDPHR